MHNHAQRILVRLHRHLARGTLLRSHEGRRSLTRTLLETCIRTKHVQRKAEVRNHGAETTRAARHEHDVACFQIPMDRSNSMRRDEAMKNLPDKFTGPIRRKRTVVPDVFAQRMAVEELHTEKPNLPRRRTFVTKQLVHPADIGMRDRPCLPHLATKALDHLRARGQVGTNDLDRHSLLQVLVPGFVHLAHTAAGEKTIQREAADKHASGRQRRECARGGFRLGR